MSHATKRTKPRSSAPHAKVYRRAADLEGRTMTDFVLHSAEAAAARTLQERAMLILTARETEAFVSAILNPPEPGPVLREAVRHYKNQTSAR